jgi:hypothetical protein
VKALLPAVARRSHEAGSGWNGEADPRYTGSGGAIVGIADDEGHRARLEQVFGTGTASSPAVTPDAAAGLDSA